MEKFIEISIEKRSGYTADKYKCISVHNELFSKIMGNAYGKNASDIILCRPNLDVENINSLEIFDEKIINSFEKSFVHELISYNIIGFSKFMVILNNPHMLANFVDYYNFLTNSYGYNISVFQTSLSTYFKNEKLFNNISFTNLSKQEQNELLEYVMNKHRVVTIYHSREEMFGEIEIQNIDDVINYNAQYKLTCLEYINSFESIITDLSAKSKFVEVASNYFFNMDFYINNFGCEDLESDINQSLQYNMSFLVDFSLDNMTDDEKKIIEVGKAICTEPVDYYLIKKFAQTNDSFDLDTVTSLFKKMKIHYIEKLNNKLLNPNFLEKKKNIQGINFYFLDGQDFEACIHRPGRAASNFNLSHVNFKDFEGQAGTSTISTWGIDSKRKDDIKIGTLLGFSNISEDEFLSSGRGFGGSSVSHYPKTVNPKSNVDNNTNLPLEIALYRRNRDYRLRGTNFDGRRIPDYIFVGLKKFDELYIDEAIRLSKKYSNIPIVIVDWSKYHNMEIVNSSNNDFLDTGESSILEQIEKRMLDKNDQLLVTNDFSETNTRKMGFSGFQLLGLVASISSMIIALLGILFLIITR